VNLADPKSGVLPECEPGWGTALARQWAGGSAVVADHRDVRYTRRACREGELLGEHVADRHDEIDAVLGCHAPDLTVGVHGFVAQLQHLPYRAGRRRSRSPLGVLDG
jgi:hypothetical protein